MSTTPTTVGIPAPRRSVKHYAILVALMFAMVAGTFGVYTLTSSERSTTAPSTVLLENDRAGNGGCSARLTIGGGPLEGHTNDDMCAAPGRPVVPGGLRAR